MVKGRTINIPDDLLPICASCKQVRDTTGHWRYNEEVMRQVPETGFTHTVCPGCARRIYPNLCEKMYDELNGYRSTHTDEYFLTLEHTA